MAALIIVTLGFRLDMECDSDGLIFGGLPVWCRRWVVVWGLWNVSTF